MLVEQLQDRLDLLGADIGEAAEVGEIVYDTGDTPEEASARDLAAFDRELAAGPGDLSRYVGSPAEVGFEDDWEVVLAEAG